MISKMRIFLLIAVVCPSSGQTYFAFNAPGYCPTDGTSVSAFSDSIVPRGCIVKSNMVYYNTHSSGSAQSAWSPVCKSGTTYSVGALNTEASSCGSSIGFGNLAADVQECCVTAVSFLNPTAAPTAAPTTAAPTAAPTVQITGDPHIRFADGGLADFRGRDNTFYNMLSASNVSLAMKTRDTTFWMPKDGKRQVVHGSFFTEAHFVLVDNGNVFYIGIDARKRGFVVKNRMKDVVANYEEWQCFDKLVRASACVRQLTLNVTTADWEFAITRRPIYNKIAGPSFYRLDVEIKRRKDSAVAHGIIGQSWDNDGIAISGKTDDYSTDEVYTSAMAEGAIEGDASDYELKDEYHTGFKYSCFTGGQSKEVLSMLGIPYQCAIRNVSKLMGKRAVAATNATSAFTLSD